MHDQRSPRGSLPHNPRFSLFQQDAQVQRGLLAVVLAEHPIQLTILELIREMSNDFEDFAERDAIECAVRNLVGVGLLHRRDGFVLPTRAALHFDQLESDCDERLR